MVFRGGCAPAQNTIHPRGTADAEGHSLKFFSSGFRLRRSNWTSFRRIATRGSATGTRRQEEFVPQKRLGQLVLRRSHYSSYCKCTWKEVDSVSNIWMDGTKRSIFQRQRRFEQFRRLEGKLILNFFFKIPFFGCPLTIRDKRVKSFTRI